MPAFHCLALCLILTMTSVASAEPFVELIVNGTPVQGAPVVHNEQICWLVGRDGGYRRVRLNSVTDYRLLPEEFHPLAPSRLAEALREQLQVDYDVVARGDYVVCAPSGQSGQILSTLDTVQSDFRGYFSRRGWRLEAFRYPLVVVVYPNRAEFERHCQAAGMLPSPLVKGFYQPQTNRVILYDVGQPEELRQTLVHEAIHQLAFNGGLHSRIGQSPRWVVEGLATMLEAEGWQTAPRRSTGGRINLTRLQHFQESRASRADGRLEKLITADESLQTLHPLDFYSEAWALTFYLAEARRPDYVRYLKRLAERDPLETEYSAEERMADFQAVFGSDVRWVETRFLRFIDAL